VKFFYKRTKKSLVIVLVVDASGNHGHAHVRACGGEGADLAGGGQPWHYTRKGLANADAQPLVEAEVDHRVESRVEDVD